MVASIIVYAAENIKPESEDLKALLKHIDYIFEQKYITGEVTHSTRTALRAV